MALEKVKIVKQEDSAAFWKPEQGKYKVVFLENGVVKDVELKEGEISQMFYVKIGVDGVEYTLSTRYRDECTEASLLGQLKALEQKMSGLDGVSVVVHVTGAGKNKRYVVDIDTAKKTGAASAASSGPQPYHSGSPTIQQDAWDAFGPEPDGTMRLVRK